MTDYQATIDELEKQLAQVKRIKELQDEIAKYNVTTTDDVTTTNNMTTTDMDPNLNSTNPTPSNSDDQNVASNSTLNTEQSIIDKEQQVIEEQEAELTEKENENEEKQIENEIEEEQLNEMEEEIEEEAEQLEQEEQQFQQEKEEFEQEKEIEEQEMSEAIEVIEEIAQQEIEEVVEATVLIQNVTDALSSNDTITAAANTTAGINEVNAEIAQEKLIQAEEEEALIKEELEETELREVKEAEEIQEIMETEKVIDQVAKFVNDVTNATESNSTDVIEIPSALNATNLNDTVQLFDNALEAVEDHGSQKRFHVKTVRNELPNMVKAVAGMRPSVHTEDTNLTRAQANMNIVEEDHVISDKRIFNLNGYLTPDNAWMIAVGCGMMAIWLGIAYCFIYCMCCKKSSFFRLPTDDLSDDYTLDIEKYHTALNIEEKTTLHDPNAVDVVKEGQISIADRFSVVALNDGQEYEQMKRVDDGDEYSGDISDFNISEELSINKKD